MYDHVVKCQRAGLCLSEHFLIKLLVLYLPDANAYCAEFADYQNVIFFQNANVFSNPAPSGRETYQ